MRLLEELRYGLLSKWWRWAAVRTMRALPVTAKRPVRGCWWASGDVARQSHYEKPHPLRFGMMEAWSLGATVSFLDYKVGFLRR